MTRRFLILTLLLLPFFSKGQQQYFNRRYDFGGSNHDAGFNILPYDSGYVLWSNSRMTSTGNLKVVISYLGSSGTTNLVKAYGDTSMAVWNYIQGTGKICNLSDSGYALSGCLRSSGTESDVSLYKFNHLGDTVFAKQYGDTLWQSGFQCKQTRDGGFIIAGQTFTYSQYGDVLLIKTDGNGLKQWEQHYGGIDQDLAFSVDTCIDGGFILSGFTMSFGTHALTDFANAYLVKTDSVGNFQWQKSFGGYFYDSFEQVLQASDGYIYAFGYYCFRDDSTFCCSGFNKPYLVKLDTAGNIQWEKTYGDSIFDLAITNAEEVNNVEFICAGYSSDTITYSSHKGLLIKINSQGDSLFYQTYEGLHGSFSQSYFFDVSADRDNGYICTGYVVPLAPDTGSNDIWVLKLDSNGCEIANCFSTGVPQYFVAKNDEPLIAYPNPFNSSFSIRANVPEKVGSSELCLMDITGRILFNESLQSGINSVEFNTGQYSTGIYFITLICDGQRKAAIRVVKTE